MLSLRVLLSRLPFALLGIAFACLAFSAAYQPALAECPGAEIARVPSSHYTTDVKVVGDYAYMTDGSYGLRIIDISDPSNPSQVGHAPSDDASYGVDVLGDYAYVADHNGGLKIFDISDAANPRLAGRISTWNYTWDVKAYRPTSSSNPTYVYLADGSGGMRVYDVSDPANPVQKGRVNSWNYTYDVTISGGYAYMADGSGGLVIADIGNPAEPAEIGRASSNHYGYGVSVSGGYVYLADSSYGLRVFDISNPAAPAQVDSFGVSHVALAVRAVGDRVYLSDRNYGLRILNASDPANLTQLGYIPTANQARKVFVSGNHLFFADGSYGLRIFDNSGCGGQDPGARGDITFVLTWTYTGSSSSEGPDIDLWVRDPNDYLLHSSREGYGLGPTPNGGRIDHDDEGGTGPGDGGGPERAYWPSGKASSGAYRFGVRYYEGDGAAQYTIKVYVNNSLLNTYSGSVGEQSTGQDIQVAEVYF